jgi:hypothetical protein
VRQDILDKVATIERRDMRIIAADLVKRAALKLLHGPRDLEAEEPVGAGGAV